LNILESFSFNLDIYVLYNIRLVFLMFKNISSSTGVSNVICDGGGLVNFLRRTIYLQFLTIILPELFRTALCVFFCYPFTIFQRKKESILFVERVFFLKEQMLETDTADGTYLGYLINRFLQNFKTFARRPAASKTNMGANKKYPLDKVGGNW